VALLSRLSRLQRITLYLFVAFVANLIIARTIVSSPGLAVFNILIFFLLLVLLPAATLGFLIRKITWRVRNRLLVTYFLVGVIPIVLIFLFVTMGFQLVLAQIANYLLHQAIDRHIEQVYLFPEAGEKAVPAPSWSKPGYRGLVRDSKATYFVAAHRNDAFVLRPFDEPLLASLLSGIASLRVIDRQTVRFRIGTTEREPDAKMILDSENVAPGPTSRGWWDLGIEAGSPLKIESLEDGKEVPSAILAWFYPSGVLGTVFSTLGQSGVVLGIFMAFVAFLFLIVEIAAVIASVQLSRTLTGTVHDLHLGTKTVEAGDFSRRIPVRAQDQLSELASSFNGMTARIEQLIGEVKEKEKLEAELEVARLVQAQLFPKEVPTLATLELAGVCNPARVVSGDYYDFIPIANRGAAVVVGDISGKGISAALLMASVQSSLHAQLAMDTDTEVSTATLVTRLNRQLYASTPAEKYATFYCAVYDDRNSRLSYTNAGHLAPILIRNGDALRLESNGTVVGIFPEYPFEQATVSLQKGDLLAAFTDGITESENAQEEQYGEDRLIELLKLHSGKPLDEILRIVMETITKWAHDPAARDDITMLLARKL
jgi:sigma-B regulation protein RsbU (phosphoserine phosphatase)